MKKLGVSFSDSVILGKQRKLHNYHKKNPDEKKGFSWPGLFIFFLFLGAILFLGFRAFDLQIVNGPKNRELTDANRIRLVRIRAPRGIIYDRNKVPLVRNTPSYIEKTKDNKFKKVSLDDALKIQAGDSSLGNASKLELRPQRQYLFGPALAHVLGYLSEINEKELKTNNTYGLGDLIGRLGIEETYEDKLRGINGEELVEVDALGKKIRSLGTKNPIAGTDITLTIDSSLQKIVSDNYPKDKKGAVVVSDPQTGEILALYSSPSFDPNSFGEETLQNPDSPMFDRVISGTYPPGSTFKIVTSSTGLDSGIITANTQIEDIGEITIGAFKFPNWYFLQYGRLEGIINIVTAIKRSNDIFFYKVGEMVGIDRLTAMARRFGLGNVLGIDLSGEAKGLVPDDAWKQKAIGDKWYLGDTYHLSIGQGYLLATPLQVNFYTNVIANGGKLCQPHLLKTVSGINTSDGVRMHSSEVEEISCKDIGLKKDTIDLITEGMKEACSTGGTGWPFFDFSLPVIPSERSESRDLKHIEIACKTGTAEFGPSTSSGQETHAWFTMFIPQSEAKDKLLDAAKAVSITVLVEGGGEGSNVAAPIAKKVLEEWIK